MQDLVRGQDLYGWMKWYAEELKFPYIPAVIMEWEITTVDTLRMLGSFAVVSYDLQLYVILLLIQYDTVCTASSGWLILK